MRKAAVRSVQQTGSRLKRALINVLTCVCAAVDAMPTASKGDARSDRRGMASARHLQVAGPGAASILGTHKYRILPLKGWRVCDGGTFRSRRRIIVAGDLLDPSAGPEPHQVHHGVAANRQILDREAIRRPWIKRVACPQQRRGVGSDHSCCAARRQ
jgi:hypothetical protein